MAVKNGLPEHIKAAVVQALACFDSPSTVVAAVKAEYGVVVTPQQCETYDPNKRAGQKLSERWRVLFAATRAAFIEDSAAIPIAHRSTRLRALWRMAERAEKQGNLALAANLHKQAAEEMGNAYTNRRELTGRNGGPIQTEDRSTATLIAEAKRLGIDPTAIGLA